MNDSKRHGHTDDCAMPEDHMKAILRDGIEVDFRDGIFVDRAWQASGVTAQFIDHADTFHENNFARADFDVLIDRCLRLADVDRTATQRVLDMGSGSGSSVLPLCHLLPAAQLVASDISHPLLALLARHVRPDQRLASRIAFCCMDIHRPFFRSAAFDLVVGSAILHHLIDPFSALKHVAESVRPGGKIVLIEPMEAGCLLLTTLYEQVLVALAEAGICEGPLIDLMRAMRRDIHARLGVPATKPWTPHLDDKWVFDVPYLHALGRQLGMPHVAVHPSQADVTTLFETSFRSLLSDSGNVGVEIPCGVIAAVRRFDQGLSDEMKRSLFPTGIIVFTKC